MKSDAGMLEILMITLPELRFGAPILRKNGRVCIDHHPAHRTNDVGTDDGHPPDEKDIDLMRTQEIGGLVVIDTSDVINHFGRGLIPIQGMLLCVLLQEETGLPLVG